MNVPVVPQAPPKVRKGRIGFLKDPTSTTLSIEKELLSAVQKAAHAAGQSVSQWIAGAANAKLKNEGMAK